MAIDRDAQIQNLKNQKSQMYNQDYFNSKMPVYTANSGGFTLDADGSVKYNERTNAVPSLNQMWGEYARGAKSRGIKPDYITFKNFYDTLNQNQLAQTKKQFIDAFENDNFSNEQITEILRENPHLSKKFYASTSGGGEDDLLLRDALAPKKQTTPSSFWEDHKLKLLAGLGGTAIGAQYLFAPRTPADHATKVKESEKLKNQAKKTHEKYVEKNRPKYTSGKNKGKVIPKTILKDGKRISNPDYVKFKESKGYKTSVSKKEAAIKKAKELIPEKKLSKFSELRKNRKLNQTGLGVTPVTLSVLSTEVAEEILKGAGFSEEDAAIGSRIISGSTGAGLGISSIKDLAKPGMMNKIKGLIKAAGSSHQIYHATTGESLWGLDTTAGEGGIEQSDINMPDEFKK